MDKHDGLGQKIAEEIKVRTNHDPEIWQVIRTYRIDERAIAEISYCAALGKFSVRVTNADTGEVLTVSNPEATPELAVQVTHWQSLSADK